MTVLKTTELYILERVNFGVYELCLNKAVIRNNKTLNKIIIIQAHMEINK